MTATTTELRDPMTDTPTPSKNPSVANPQLERVIREVTRHLANLRFGSIEILIHDGNVVSIERRERTRFAPTSSRHSADS